MAAKNKKRTTARKLTTAPDAIALLKADHAKVTAMFQQYDKLGDRAQAKKGELCRRICNELKVHAQIEEEIFYPAARAALPKEDDLLDEAQVEHDGAKQLIAQLDAMEPGEDLYDAKVTVLGEYIKHHVKEEQNEMFPAVRKSKLDLRELGMRLAFRKEELMKQLGA
jgi:hemerythrin-like domain-containing protein